jgi:hypothetical protein
MLYLNGQRNVEGLAVSQSGTLYQSEGFPSYVAA